MNLYGAFSSAPHFPAPRMMLYSGYPHSHLAPYNMGRSLLLASIVDEPLTAYAWTRMRISEEDVGQNGSKIRHSWLGTVRIQWKSLFISTCICRGRAFRFYSSKNSAPWAVIQYPCFFRWYANAVSCLISGKLCGSAAERHRPDAKFDVSVIIIGCSRLVVRSYNQQYSSRRNANRHNDIGFNTSGRSTSALWWRDSASKQQHGQSSFTPFVVTEKTRIFVAIGSLLRLAWKPNEQQNEIHAAWGGYHYSLDVFLRSIM
jgi:hypothetical protein